MNCKHTKPLISRYLDRELPDDLRRSFEEHIALCPACRQETDELRSLLEVIEKPADVPVPERLYALIRDRLPDRSRVYAEPWWKPVLIPALATAAFILTVFASVSIIPRIIPHRAGQRLQVTSATMDLTVFHDEPRSSFASAYSRITGE